MDPRWKLPHALRVCEEHISVFAMAADTETANYQPPSPSTVRSATIEIFVSLDASIAVLNSFRLFIPDQYTALNSFFRIMFIISNEFQLTNHGDATNSVRS